jgi:hypothetical protein
LWFGFRVEFWLDTELLGFKVWLEFWVRDSLFSRGVFVVYLGCEVDDVVRVLSFGIRFRVNVSSLGFRIPVEFAT